MLNLKDHKTLYMFDPFEYLGPKRRKMLNDSWAGIFRDHVRHVLPVDLLARHYCSDNGRPTNELVAMMVDADLEDQRQQVYLRDGGFNVKDYHE